MPRDPQRPLSRYGFALLITILAIIVRVPLSPLLGNDVPFILFFPTVTLCAWYGGFGPGLLATVLSALAALFLYIEPSYSLALNGPREILRLALFLSGSTFISWICGSLRAANQEARVLIELREQAIASEQSAAELFATTLKSIGEAVITTDERGAVTFLNAVAQNLTGWQESEAQGKPLAEVFKIINEQSRAEVESPVSKVLREGNIVGLANHTLLISRDGREIPIDDSGAPIREGKGRIVGVVLVFRDITEQRHAETEKARLAAEVEFHRTHLQAMVAGVPGVVWEAWGEPKAADQQIDFVSDYVETMLGYSIEEWLSQLNFWRTIVHQDDKERAGQEAAAIFAGGKGGVSRFRWLTKDGRTISVESQSVVICDQEGQPI
jgi:PAS domain S-box-containing protein